MYAFALHELGLSWDYIKDMTWREFQLRRVGYIRQEKEEWKRSRFEAYYSLVATGAIDTKKMSLEKFMPLDGKQAAKVTSAGLEAYKRAMGQYKKETNG